VPDVEYTSHENSETNKWVKLKSDKERRSWKARRLLA